MNGEGDPVAMLMQLLLAKHWHFCGDFYRRVKQRRNRTNCCIPTDSMPKSYSMKANMLSGVDSKDQMYSPREGAMAISAFPNFAKPVSAARTAIAVSRLDKGIVCYIGDVNAEDSTVHAVGITPIFCKTDIRSRMVRKYRVTARVGLVIFFRVRAPIFCPKLKLSI